MPFPPCFKLPPASDFHVHLRDDVMMKTVTPTIKQGGVDTAYIMPNLVPPITTVEAALAYKSRLEAVEPSVKYLMTLYLEPSITRDTIVEASRAGGGGVIVGLKAYPAGVTTNSSAGVVDYNVFYPVFEAMQEYDLVLNLHGEVPSTTAEEQGSRAAKESGVGDVTVLNAEERFLPTLKQIHADFPRLRIVLEHCTTAAAIEAVNSCGPTVAGTITAHHLWLTIDEVCGDAFNFCKPIAKLPGDRLALLRAVLDGGSRGKFFFGSDSAPHPLFSKTGVKKAAAGCFTQGWVTQLVVQALEAAAAHGWVSEDELSPGVVEEFMRKRGRAFYKLDDGDDNDEEKPGMPRIVLERDAGAVVPEVVTGEEGLEVVPFRRGSKTWGLRWKTITS